MAESQAVRADVSTFGKNVVLTLSSAGVGSIPIELDPQAASELGENLARAAFEAFHGGKPARTDISHLHAQLSGKVTEQMAAMLSRRIAVMLNSTRENRDWSNEKLATEIVQIILAKVA